MRVVENTSSLKVGFDVWQFKTLAETWKHLRLLITFLRNACTSCFFFFRRWMSNCHFAVGSRARTNDELQREMFWLLKAKALCACLTQKKNCQTFSRFIWHVRRDAVAHPHSVWTGKGHGDEVPSLFLLLSQTYELWGDWTWRRSSTDQWVNKSGKGFKRWDKKGMTAQWVKIFLAFSAWSEKTWSAYAKRLTAVHFDEPRLMPFWRWGGRGSEFWSAQIIMVCIFPFKQQVLISRRNIFKL